MVICGVDGYFGRYKGWSLDSGPLGLDFAGLFDERTDERFCIAIYDDYNAWWDGLGDCLVHYL